MKKVIQERFSEQAEYYCDNHPERRCYSQLELISWYGSQFDLNKIEVHLCDECVQGMYDLLAAKFNVVPKEVEI